MKNILIKVGKKNRGSVFTIQSFLLYRHKLIPFVPAAVSRYNGTHPRAATGGCTQVHGDGHAPEDQRWIYRYKSETQSTEEESRGNLDASLGHDYLDYYRYYLIHEPSILHLCLFFCFLYSYILLFRANSLIVVASHAVLLPLYHYDSRRRRARCRAI